MDEKRSCVGAAEMQLMTAEKKMQKTRARSKDSKIGIN